MLESSGAMSYGWSQKFRSNCYVECSLIISKKKEIFMNFRNYVTFVNCSREEKNISKFIVQTVFVLLREPILNLGKTFLGKSFFFIIEISSLTNL